MADEPKTYTQDEVEKMLEERTAGLKANRDELAKEAKTAKAKLAAYDGLDPEETRRLKAAAEEAERKKAAAEGNWQAMEKQLKDLHGQELTKERGRADKALKALEDHAVRGTLASALAKAGAKPGFTDLLLLEGQKYVKIRETDGGFESFVGDPAGNPLVADAQGNPMTVELFVEQKLKTQYPDAFNGSGSSGGGAAKSSAGGGGGAQVIAAGDNAGFISNLKDIAAGKVEVRTP